MPFEEEKKVSSLNWKDGYMCVMDRWIDGSLEGGQMDRLILGQTDGQVDRWIDRLMDGQMDMDRWIDEWMV